MARSAGRSRRRFTTEERQRWVERFRSSGLSQYRFAKVHGIPASYLTRWKREAPAREARPEAGFLPVSVIHDSSRAGGERLRGFDVRLPSGIELGVPADFDRGALEELLAVLGAARC